MHSKLFKFKFKIFVNNQNQTNKIKICFKQNIVNLLIIYPVFIDL